MDSRNSLKSEKKNTLCEVLNTNPICNGQCKVHSFFSDRMDFYSRSLVHLEAGPPKEVVVCYANPFFYNCAIVFSRELEEKIAGYLDQFNPKIEITDQKIYLGSVPFDFSRSLEGVNPSEAPLPFIEKDSGSKEYFDPISDSLKKYLRSRIQARVQDSPLRFQVYSSSEDRPLAEKVVQKVLREMGDELISLTLQKPVFKVEHGIPLEFGGAYTIDLDYLIHQGLDKKLS